MLGHAKKILFPSRGTHYANILPAALPGAGRQRHATYAEAERFPRRQRTRLPYIIQAMRPSHTLPTGCSAERGSGIDRLGPEHLLSPTVSECSLMVESCALMQQALCCRGNAPPRGVLLRFDLRLPRGASRRPMLPGKITAVQYFTAERAQVLNVRLKGLVGWRGCRTEQGVSATALCSTRQPLPYITRRLARAAHAPRCY
jgi:hypothetical protein